MGKLSDFPLAAQMTARPLPPGDIEESGGSNGNSRYSDVVGVKFGKLTFKAPATNYERTGARQALFSCECGGERVAQVSMVKIGRVSSCGCLRSGPRKPQAGVAPVRQKRTKPGEREKGEKMGSEDVELYLKYPDMFLADFWVQGCCDLNISVEPRAVQSGVWFEATWKTATGETRHAEAQRMRLLWERIIKRFLQDEPAATAEVK